jgi:hypothetical protein
MAGVSGVLWGFDRAGHSRAEHDGSYLGPDPAQRGESERVGHGPLHEVATQQPAARDAGADGDPLGTGGNQLRRQ